MCVKDLDWVRNEVTIRRGKGAKDCVSVIPRLLREPLASQIEAVREQHRRDCAAGDDAGWVMLPDALARKYPQAGARYRGSGSFRQADCMWMRHPVAGSAIICTSRQHGEP